MTTSQTQTQPPTADQLLARRLIQDAVEAGPDFGDRKVFLCRLLDLTDAETCTALQRLHHAGLVRLARADLVAAMDHDLVTASEWRHPEGGATFHFLLLPVA